MINCVKIILLIVCTLGLTCMTQAAEDPSGKGSGSTARKPALFDAAMSGKVAAVRALVEKGADVNQSVNGFTPLCFALQPDVILYLIERGADVNAPFAIDDPRMRHQYLVTVVWMTRPDIVALAFRHGLTQTSMDKMWFIFISWLRIGIISTSEQQLMESTRLMLEHGADVSAKGIEGETPLMSAVRVGSVEITKLLIEQRADLFAKDDAGRSILTIAKMSSRKNTQELIDMLLQAGAKE
jgi:ankyrin repeat protein